MIYPFILLITLRPRALRSHDRSYRQMRAMDKLNVTTKWSYPVALIAEFKIIAEKEQPWNIIGMSKVMPAYKNLTGTHHHLGSIIAKFMLNRHVYRCSTNHCWERIILTWFRDTKCHAGAQWSHWNTSVSKVMPGGTNFIETHPRLLSK